ncbi:hypothetical protein E2C01_008047 [Portunus trituberculatus]|uniref:Uncharacterized protein n=1 Tax=Portunus trituberculatus TaxID=210409 RepID=A0A5B7D223_PORTR|nr:hypothetical protein [Portunus trituberculatus]
MVTDCGVNDALHSTEPELPTTSRENLSDQSLSSTLTVAFFFPKNAFDLKEKRMASLLTSSCTTMLFRVSPCMENVG